MRLIKSLLTRAWAALRLSIEKAMHWPRKVKK